MSETREKRIKTALQEGLNPRFLEVVDESHKHVGHAGAQPEGETHYRILIVSGAFDLLKRVARHRLINDLLANEFENGLHALSVKALTPQEYE